MGGARSEKELKLFLKNMFLDKRIISSPLRYLLSSILSNMRYKKVWQEYLLIGGSPIYDITEKLINKFDKLRDETVVLSMRYTQPYLNEVIHQFDKITLVPLYPHYSTTTVESSLDELKQTNFKGKVRIIKPFYKEDAYNKIIIDNIKNAVNNPGDWHIIFSAHGLPQKLIDKGDVYLQQIEEHVSILSKHLSEFESIDLAFQSRVSPVKWIEPYLDESLKNYKNKKVLIYPLSFVIDNSETLLELNIGYRKLADKIGITDYKVVACPNDTDDFVAFLNRLV
jgi:ferrochelatase